METVVFILFAVALRFVVFSHHVIGDIGKGFVDIFNLQGVLVERFQAMAKCSFCSGVWAGLFIAVLNNEWYTWFEMLVLFPVTCGFISLLIEEHRALNEEQYKSIKYSNDMSSTEENMDFFDDLPDIH